MIEEEFKILREASSEYYNSGDSKLTDEEFDNLESKLKRQDPGNEYFIGVGSTVRGAKVDLPFPLGSLTQIQVGCYDKWIIDDGISNDSIVVSAKMDGVSALLVYNTHGEFQISYSRGNGRQGQDITRHVVRFPSVPNVIKVDKTTAIRTECIISKSNFKLFLKECESQSYKIYKNPRNAVAGLLNSKEIPEWAVKYIDVVAYEMIGDLDKRLQLETLLSVGFLVVPYTISLGSEIVEKGLEEEIYSNKCIGKFQDYEQDGVVLDVDDSRLRVELNINNSSLNPEYAKKYKVKIEDSTRIAKVVNVSWTASKNMLLKPRIELEPFDLNGVTISFTTGFNAKYIIDNGVNIGTTLKMIRSGDVIPYILEVVESSDVPLLPDVEEHGSYSLSDSGVDFVLDETNIVVVCKQLESFFSSLEIGLLGPGNILKLYNAGYDSIPKILNMGVEDLELLVGVNGLKIYNNINERFKDIREYEFLGSLPCFRGIGIKRFESLYDHHGYCKLDTCESLLEVKGFDDITSDKIIKHVSEYYDIIDNINRDIDFKDKEVLIGSLSGTSWVFTGYRDKLANKIIEDNGGVITAGITKNTTYLVTKDPSKSTSKLNKAREFGVDIIDPIMLNTMLEKI